MPSYQEYSSAPPLPAGGHYRIGFLSGLVTGLTAGQYWFAWRWTLPNLFCRMHQVRVAASINAAFTTAQSSDVALFRAQNWATAPTAGSTITLPTSNNNVMATQGAVTPMAQLSSFIPPGTFAGMAVISNTGALTTGTPTIDANPLSYEQLNMSALASSARVVMYDEVWGRDFSMTFGALEGFLLSVPTLQGAVGVIQYYVNLVFSVNNTLF